MTAPSTPSPRNQEVDFVVPLIQAQSPVQAGDDALLGRVKERLLRSIGLARTGLGHHTIRAAEGHWQSVGPGLERKLLWESGDAFSCLLRGAPGAIVPGHSHPIDEECVVLEGTFRIGNVILLAGDFHVGVQGVRHEDASTDTGVLVYLRGAKPRPTVSV